MMSPQSPTLLAERQRERIARTLGPLTFAEAIVLHLKLQRLRRDWADLVARLEGN